MHDDVCGCRRRPRVDLVGRGTGPLVHEARVYGAHDHAEPRHHVQEPLVQLVGGNGARERSVRVGEVAQERPLAAGDAQALDVALEVGRRLHHVAQDRLAPQLVVGCPGNLCHVALEGLREELLERHRVAHLLDALDPLVVVDALGLHLGHGLVAGLALLRAQDLRWVLERRLDHADEVERIGIVLGVQKLECREQEGSKRLVEREVVRQLDGGRVGLASTLDAHALHDPGVDQCGEDLLGACRECGLLFGGLHGVLDEPEHPRPGVASLLDLGEHHGVRDAQAWAQGLGCGGDEPLEGLLVPAHVACGWLLGHDLAGAPRVAPGLRQGAGVLDLVLGRLCDNEALGVEARTSRPACHLMELSRVETAHAAPIKLRELGQKDGVDGYVDTHAESVCAADHGEQPALRELLHEKSVARKHARVVHAHTHEQQATQGLAEARGEARVGEGVLDLLALLLCRDAKAREVLRGLQGCVLGKVYDVERGLPCLERDLDRGLERRVHEAIAERDGARRVQDELAAAVRVLLKGGGDGADVAECGAHEQELHVW